MSLPQAPASEPAPILTITSLARNGDLLRRAANVIRRGGIVAFPTECVYMLGCRADDPEAVKRLCAVRRRPSDVPLTLYCAHASEAEPYVREPSELVQRFASLFWPGPLTLVLPRGAAVPDAVTAGLAKVAIRVPSHRIAQTFLEFCKGPVVATTARLPGGLPPVDRDAVYAAFGGEIDLMLEGREPPLGLEPTVLDLTGRDPRIVRLGFVRPREIERLAGRPVVLSSDDPTPSRFTRFSPEARLVVVEGEADRVARRLKFLRDTLGGKDAYALLLTPGMAEAFQGEPGVHVLPDPTAPEDLSEALFGLLRRLGDHDSLALILVEGLPREGPTAATMERLTRVAHQVINTEDPGYAGQGGMQPRERGR